MSNSAIRIGEIVGNVDSVTISRFENDPNRILLTVQGWLLHSLEEISDLYFEAPKALKTSSIREQRPDLLQQFPGLPYAAMSGYKASFEFAEASIVTPLAIKLYATLSSGALIQSQVEIPIQLPSLAEAAPKTNAAPDLATIALRAFLTSSARLSFQPVDKPKLSIIIVTFNRAAQTLACLQALSTQLDSRHEIIIIENASSDQTKLLLAKVDGITLIENATNRHFLLGTLQGAESAKGEFLLFLNNDAQVLPGGISAILESFADHPNLGALGARLIHPTGMLQEVGSHLHADGSAIGIGVGEHVQGLPFLFQRSVDFCSGAFLATPKALWQELGGFDPLFAPAYYEDADYCLRVRARGFDVLVEPRISVIHHEGAVGVNSTEANSLMNINRQKFVDKHADFFAHYKERSISPYSINAPQQANSKRALLVDDFFPIQTTGQGAPRSKLICDTLLRDGYTLTCVALNETSPARDVELNAQIEYLALRRESALLEFLALRGASFGTIVISRPHNMVEFLAMKEKYPICAKNCLIIYDAEAIFALREIGQRKVSQQTEFTIEQIEQIVSTEILKVQNANQIWVTSQAEQEEFIRRGIERVHVVGYATSIVQSDRDFNQRKNALFLGPITSEDAPNGEGFLWFMNRVFPYITIPSFQITQIGSYTLQKKFPPSLVNHQGIQKDLRPYFEDARIFIAPIRYGAGIPLKVIEAAAYGLPVVTTPYIAQQLSWQNGEQLLVANDAKEFKDKIDQLYYNQELWEKLRNNALVRVHQEYSLVNFQKNLREQLNFRE
jgi:GT2 family glycosyltransferase